MLRFLTFFVFLLTCALSTQVTFAEKPKKQSVKKQAASAKKQSQKAKEPKAKEVEPDNAAIIKAPGTSDIALHSTYAIVMDYHTGKVLLEKNADERMTPSSMTKIMTSFIIEEKLIKNEIKPDTMFMVSEKAWKTEGTRTFLPLNASVSVMDLLRGIIIQSGNDASVTAAEGISGSEENFVSLMNDMAKELGLTNTHFKNTSGLPEEGHYSSARDLAKLSIALIRHHPQYYPLYSEKEFSYNNIKQGNRNPLLYNNLGCDGIKTGHSNEAGYGIVASCVDGDQRYIIVINGLKTMQQRANEARKILGWTKQNFLGKTVFKKGDIVEKEAPVWLGEKKTIALKTVDDISLLLPRNEQGKLEVKVQYDSPIQAPIKEDQVIGKIIVTSPSVSYEVGLAAAESCPRASFFARLWNSIQYLVTGKS